MPVLGYAIARPPTTTRTCVEQAITRPRVSTYEGVPILGRRQAVTLVQGQAGSIRWIFRDSAGDAVDLTACLNLASSSSSSSSSSEGAVGVVNTLKLRFREALDRGCDPSTEINGSIVNSAAGEAAFAISSTHTRLAGVYLAEFAVLDDVGDVIFTNTAYLVVNPGQFGGRLSNMPALGAIRLRLRDSSPEDNFLLTNVEFDDAEIADAIVRTIRWFNDAQPPIPQRYSTQNFPYEERCFDGIVACLYETAAMHYTREDVDYAAAGVSFNDKKKGALYMQFAEKHRQEYLRWVKLKRVQLNVEQGFSSFGSAYGLIG